MSWPGGAGNIKAVYLSLQHTAPYKKEWLKENFPLLKCCAVEQNYICILCVFRSPSDALPLLTRVMMCGLLRTGCKQ